MQTELEQVIAERDFATSKLEQCISAAERISEFAEELGIKAGERYTVEGVIALVSAYKDTRNRLKDLETEQASREQQYVAVLATLQRAAKADHKQYLYNNTTLIKYIMAAHDDTGEIRAAILEQAVDWIRAEKPATLDDVVKPVTVG